MMNPVLAEQGAGCVGGCTDSGNCGQSPLCGQDNCCPWYASLEAIVVGRSDGRRLWTSYEDGNLMNQLTNTQFGLQWKWGGEVKFGRRFCCDCVPYAVEVSYWTADPFTGFRSTTVPGGYVSTPLDLNSLVLWRHDEPIPRPELVRRRPGASAMAAGRVPRHRSQYHPRATGLGQRLVLGHRLVAGSPVFPLPGLPGVRHGSPLRHQLGRSSQHGVLERPNHQQPGRRPVRLRRGISDLRQPAAIHLAEGRHLRQLPGQQLHCDHRQWRRGSRPVWLLSGARDAQRSLVPDAGRYRRRLAFRPELERSGGLPRGCRHRRRVGRRPIPAVHLRHAGDRQRRALQQSRFYRAGSSA